MPSPAHAAITGRTGVLAILGDPAVVSGLRAVMRVEQIGQMIDFMIGPCDASRAP